MKDRTLNVVQNINYLLSTLEQVSAQKLLEYVPSSEFNDIYIKFEVLRNMDISVSLFNANTKSIVKKIYTFPELLKICTDIFTVMYFVDKDILNLYNKSKEHIFDENTVLSI